MHTDPDYLGHQEEFINRSSKLGEIQELRHRSLPPHFSPHVLRQAALVTTLVRVKRSGHSEEAAQGSHRYRTYCRTAHSFSSNGKKWLLHTSRG